MINEPIVEWSVDPPSQSERALERTLFNTQQQTFLLTWPDFSPTIRISYSSYNSSGFTTVAEFIADPELDGTVFICSESNLGRQVVLHVASMYNIMYVCK